MFILRFLEFGQKIIFSFSLQVFESVLYLGNPVIIFRQHRYRETMPLMNEIKLIIIEILTKTDLYCDVMSVLPPLSS